MIVLLAGVSGCGKSTVGKLLASRLDWPFIDGDSLHPAANIAKMRAGAPLTDEDRWPWLEAVAAVMDDHIAAGRPAVIACSALKRSYRDLLAGGRPQARMVFLDAGRDLLAARLAARHGHFFRADLLDSQLAALEHPQPAERILMVPAADPADQVAEQIISTLRLRVTPGRAAQPE
jgi:gluconokinase